MLDVKANDIFLPFQKFDDKLDIKLNKKDEFLLNLIKIKVQNNEFNEAIQVAKKITDAQYKDIIETYILAEAFKQINYLTSENFINLINFNINNYFLPTFTEFNIKIEQHYLNNNDMEYSIVKKYFTKFKSKNLDVNIKLFKQQENYIYTKLSGNELNEEKVKYINEIKNFLFNFDFNFEYELNSFINAFKHILTEDDIIEKIKYIFFTREFKKFPNLTQYITDNDYIVFFHTILEIEKNSKNINTIIKKIPSSLKNDELLLYTKLIYIRKHNDNIKDVLGIFYKLKQSSKYPKYWWKYRHIYARELMKDKEYKKAYYLLATHNNPVGTSEYVDAEWISGWVVYRFLERADIAIEHFSNFYNNVSYPISTSRGAYWLGRAYYSVNNFEKAKEMFIKGSSYSLNFYGQLSVVELEKIKKEKNSSYQEDTMISLPLIDESNYNDKKNVLSNRIVYFAYFYYFYLNQQEDKMLDLMKEAIKKANTKGEIVEMVKIAQDFNDVYLLFQISKQAAYRDVFFVNYLYPYLKFIYDDKINLNVSLVHAIIRQESAFSVGARSGVGARGFMQIMPATAKLLCKTLKIQYNEYKLSRDPTYNVYLGNYYINSLINQFKGSKILAIASYNAGPNNAKRWAREFNDVRDYTDIYNVLDWLESITYYETRNYVQRVLENLVVYETITK